MSALPENNIGRQVLASPEINVALNEMLRTMADAIKFDCRAIIESGTQQLVEPEIVGSALTEVVELSKTTIRKKVKLGAISPETPRLRFGALEDSIVSGSLFEDSAFVTVEGEELKALWMQDGTRTIPARPFFGISERALAEVNNIQRKTEELLAEKINGVRLEPMDITIESSPMWAEPKPEQAENWYS